MVKDDRHGITQSDYMKFKRAWDKHDALMKERLPDQEYEIKKDSEMRVGSEYRLMEHLLFIIISLCVLVTSWMIYVKIR